MNAGKSKLDDPVVEDTTSDLLVSLAITVYSSFGFVEVTTEEALIFKIHVPSLQVYSRGFHIQGDQVYLLDVLNHYGNK